MYIKNKIAVLHNANEFIDDFVHRLEYHNYSVEKLFVDEYSINDEQGLTAKLARFNCDLIINANFKETLAVGNEKKTELINKDGARVIAKVAEKDNYCLYHLSSALVFNGTKQTPYLETDIPNATTIIGQSYLQGEKYIKLVNSKALIFRTTYLFGSSKTDCVATTLESANNNDTLYADDNLYFAPTWCEHLADVLIKIYESDIKKTIIHPIHFCGWPFVSEYDFIRAILEEGKKHALYNGSASLIPKDNKAEQKKQQNNTLDCTFIHSMLPTLRNRWHQGVGSSITKNNDSNY